MEKDPVCGMQINAHMAAASAIYGGKTYYFCSEACKRMFEESPSTYVPESQAA